jgi:hypothetical protein
MRYKFTPAPWTVDLESDAARDIMHSDELLATAYIMDDGGVLSGRANAHLIAAAPDLYVALETCVAWINPNLSEKLDDLSGRFYRETGIMAPGKSVPLEMAATQPPDDARSASWKQWVDSTVKIDVQFAIAALKAARGESEAQ